MRILVPMGTRPEIIKLAPVVAALRAAGHDTQVLATGQQDVSFADTSFADVHLSPDIRWQHQGSEGERLGGILSHAFTYVARDRPDVVVVLGDTYTVPTFCLASRRHAIPVVHLEAGLKSFNPTSMEEVNRQVARALAALHLAPTELAAKFLMSAAVEPERVRVVGNPIIDVLQSCGVAPRHPRERQGVVVTAHRATNVNDPRRLAAVVAIVKRLADEVGPVTFPLHPRTENRLREAEALSALDRDGIRVSPPLPWRQMLDLIASSRLVVTDSGGLQEEASFFGVPVVVLRRSSPRWESVAAGISVLTGLDVDFAIETANRLAGDDEQARVAAHPCPYGDGRTSERVASLLTDPGTVELLAIDEPDFVGAPPPC